MVFLRVVGGQVWTELRKRARELLTSMRFDSSLSTKIKTMSKTMKLLKDYAVLSDNTWLLMKLEIAELEVAIEATKDVVNILEI